VFGLATVRGSTYKETEELIETNAKRFLGVERLI